MKIDALCVFIGVKGCIPVAGSLHLVNFSICTAPGLNWTKNVVAMGNLNFNVFNYGFHFLRLFD